MSPRSRGTLKKLHSADQRTFCAVMRETRTKAGMTQHDLAKRLKRPQSFVAKIEGGERRLDVLEFLDVVDAIGADPVRTLRALLKRLG
jgi:transcriptional regulator with XRE-family HTH domain